jgi:transcriptional regulator with XRE-family HTH domain
MTRERLAEISGVPMRTLARMEMDEGSPRPGTLSAIRGALEAAGIIFVDENGEGPGVRLRKSPL